MTKLEWRIFYADDATFSNLDGLVQDAPKWGAVAVVQRDSLTNHSVLTGPWFYYWRGQWWATDNDGGVGFLDKIVHFVHEIDAVLPGRWIDDEEWNKIIIRAQSDPDFPSRGGWKPNERRPR